MSTRISLAGLTAALVLLSAGLTACGGSSPGSAAQASAKSSAAAAASVAVGRACAQLQSWDSSDTDESTVIAAWLAGTRAGADFGKMLSASKNGDASGVSAAGQALAADCLAQTGITIHLTTTVADPDGKTCAALDAAGYCPGDNPSPSASAASASPTMTRQIDLAVFDVSGSGYPSIQYGTDSDNNNVQGGYGPLGDGVALPWSASITYHPNALYYAVTAQLEGSGDISDSVTEVITTYCSDGHHKTESFPLASGHASGGYAIAQAEYSNLGGGTGNAEQAESDAGC